MIRLTSSIHNHCSHCDGENTPREMIELAISKGFTDFGFSSHSYIECLNVPQDLYDEESYRKDIFALKKEYEGKIRVYCGLELEYYSLPRTGCGYDYILDSVHELYVGGECHSLARGKSYYEKTLREVCGGDGYKLVDIYYDTVSQMIQDRKPEVCCHFDLVTKYNDNMRYFDESDKRYLSKLYDTLDFAIKNDVIIELNYGAIPRQYRTVPSPPPYALPFLKERGARILISNDCHANDFIDFGLCDGVKLLVDNGFKCVTVYENGKYVEKPLV